VATRPALSGLQQPKFSSWVRLRDMGHSEEWAASSSDLAELAVASRGLSR